MSRYYRVGPAIWLEPWDDDTRYVAFYVLTCEHRSTEGLFRLPIAYAVDDLGWPVERFGQAFDELQRVGFISYDHDAAVCLITKALLWQAPENPNQVKAAVKAFAKVPDSPLQRVFLGLAERYCQRLAEGLREAFPELMAEEIAESPSPSPAPEPPLTPPQAGGTTAPAKPTGNRKTEDRDYRERMVAWTAHHFPGASVSGVEKLVTWLRSHGDEPTPDAVRGLAESEPNFSHLLEVSAA